MIKERFLILFQISLFQVLLSYSILMYPLTILITCMMFLWWCMQRNTIETNVSTGWVYKDTQVIASWDDQEPLKNISNTGNDYTMFLDDKKSETVSLFHSAGKVNTISFINSESKGMQVIIHPMSWMNLRLSQIIMPDGTMDGPFGKDTTYKLDQLGWYQLLFNENMMAWDPWSWNVTITVFLK